jgi:hypothetical protein
MKFRDGQTSGPYIPPLLFGISSVRNAEEKRLERNRWRGNLVGALVSIGFVGSVLAVARIEGWNRDRAMWVGFGGFLAVMTILRPFWFWKNYRARWLRNLIGDEATAAVYLVFAAMMVWIGLNTNWGFGRR